MKNLYLELLLYPEEDELEESSVLLDELEEDALRSTEDSRPLLNNEFIIK